MNDYEIDLCSKMLVHAFHADRTQNLKSSEIKTTLAIFFDDEVIQKAVERIIGKAIVHKEWCIGGDAGPCDCGAG